MLILDQIGSYLIISLKMNKSNYDKKSANQNQVQENFENKYLFYKIIIIKINFEFRVIRLRKSPVFDRIHH